MPVSSFESLCAAICELADAPAPPLARDANGALAVSLRLEGLGMTLSHEPGRSESHALLSASLGAPSRRGDLQSVRDLMDANAALLRHAGTSIARHPHTGEFALQRVFALDEIDPNALFGHMRDLSRQLRAWPQAGGPLVFT